VLLQQAADALRAGRSGDAGRLLRLAAERYHSVQAWLELARLQSRAGDPTAALDSLSKARTIAPNAEDVLSAYAQLSLASKMPLPAVLTLQSLTRVYPTEPQYHYLLGVGLMAIGDMPSAVEALIEADRLEPDHALTLLALGLALNNRKLFGEARVALTRSLELQPDSTDAVAALAEAEAGLGDYAGAAGHAQQALQRSAGHVTANLVMGMVLMERHNYTDARDTLLKAAASDPESPKIVYELSLVYARLGDETSARRYVELYQEKLRGVEERLKNLRQRR
jgi:tetratricopeptide (TPR) repeat protein